MQQTIPSQYKPGQTNIKYPALAKALQQASLQAIKLPNQFDSDAKNAQNQQTSQLIKPESEENDLLQGESSFYCQCPLCAQNFIFQELLSLAKCGHRFCKNCCAQYAKQQIKSFRPISCPTGCGGEVNIEDSVFSFLSEEEKKTYKKAQFIRYTDREGLTRCPNHSCDFGVMVHYQALGQNVMECCVCLNKYCSKCWWPHHRGDCNGAVDSFIQNKLLFATCPGCKKKIQRNEGCNHMTCVCRYQFCYLCLQRWTNDHICATNHSRINRINARELDRRGQGQPPNLRTFELNGLMDRAELGQRIRQDRVERELRAERERQQREREERERMQRFEMQENFGRYQQRREQQLRSQRRREMEERWEQQLLREMERRIEREYREYQMQAPIFQRLPPNHDNMKVADKSKQTQYTDEPRNFTALRASQKVIRQNQPASKTQLNLQTKNNLTVQSPRNGQLRSSTVQARSPQARPAFLKNHLNQQMIGIDESEERKKFLKHFYLVKPGQDAINRIRHAEQRKEKKTQVRLEKMRERAYEQRIKQLEQMKKQELWQMKRNQRMAKNNQKILASHFVL